MSSATKKQKLEAIEEFLGFIMGHAEIILGNENRADGELPPMPLLIISIMEVLDNHPDPKFTSVWGDVDTFKKAVDILMEQYKENKESEKKRKKAKK